METKINEGRKAMNVHDWRFWVTNSGMVMGIIGSILLNPQVISAGLILGLGGLFWDSYLERKKALQK